MNHQKLSLLLSHLTLEIKPGEEAQHIPKDQTLFRLAQAGEGLGKAEEDMEELAMPAKPKVKVQYKERVIYRNPFNLENISWAKQWIAVVLPALVYLYGWVIPQLDAQAAEYVKQQFIAVGMDPATLNTLRISVEDLKSQLQQQDKVREKLADDVGDLKTDLKGVLILLQQQQQMVPTIVPMQAAPIPVPMNLPSGSVPSQP